MQGRVNSNDQDFRHECQSRGGRSKCHICEEIECSSDTGFCQLQLQGVNSSEMSINIPTVSDTSWAVGGSFRHDYGSNSTSHFCVMLTGGNCTLSSTTDFSSCVTRCFGYGFTGPPVVRTALRRSVVDRYPGMDLWYDNGKVDLWVQPRNCSELSSLHKINCTYKDRTPSYNPQGFSFTEAGSGAVGFLDGESLSAEFNSPEDVAVDILGNIFVADTGNNAIRMISNGVVTTIAGKGPSYKGYVDGECSNATFSSPKGLDVRMQEISGETIIYIAVADTGNHRIRQIAYNPSTKACKVSCLSGLCGNNTLSATLSKTRATPLSGYADGSGLEARFSAPESLVFMDDNSLVVADTGNFLLRWVLTNGTAYTLAGTVVHGEVDANGNPMPGCTPPCMVGQQGFRDGNLTYSQFYNPLGVSKGANNTVWVVDENRLRLVELPNVISHIYSIHSTGRVSTIAGDALQGHDDGIGEESTFFYPSDVFVAQDNVVYIVDSASCRIRRVTPIPLVAQRLSCSTTAVSLVRPSGCTSFDQAIDAVGMKVSRVEANIQYNYYWPYSNHKDQGKYIKNCVGSPPRDRLQKHFLNVSGDNLVIDDLRVSINEDSEQGMAIVVYCPGECLSSSDAFVYGTHWYSEMSSVCLAAIHDGVLNNTGGYIQLYYERRDYINSTQLHYVMGSTANGITSFEYPNSTFRVFSIVRFYEYMNMVHTIGGHPMADLQTGCGFRDAQPPTLALFNRPTGIAAVPNISLSDSNFLYIADANNNRIRGMSAVCTQICENGGRCIGHDICDCPSGWSGIDCTTPICSTSCGINQVCVGPDMCGCKPGYNGSSCSTPQCVQHCHNGGYCSAPDTCSCPSGWFDSNCTTPVCSLTCANGGNCTAPNTCACPSEWGGDDCRIPQCKQTCNNDGKCVAPNTCICSPQYTGYDCSIPVCSQGYFLPNPSMQQHHLYTTHLVAWPTYKYCDMETWCNFTREFECDQLQMSYGIIEVPSGPFYRAKTGRKEPPDQCMMIELPIRYKLPFELLKADNTTTGSRRFSPFTPYESNDKNPWKGYLSPTSGHTGPWAYFADRQIAYVNWLNVSQGVYVCANGGNCTAPDVCECAPGWAGFDCRTPICDQGYWYPNQTTYVSGQETADELTRFEVFLGNNSYRLDWPYSNPNYTIEWEVYVDVGHIQRTSKEYSGKRYLGTADWSTGKRRATYQGGYRCSIRAVTQWENMSYMCSHPNYYSRYMNEGVQKDGKTYTFWNGMDWPPTYEKSKVLDQFVFNMTFGYTNEGFRRHGIWNRTWNDWVHGLCIMEFSRNCSGDPNKELDLVSDLYHVLVQDTDISYRPRITYNDMRVVQEGRWKEAGGSCVDEVVRGCYNNGTCIAPNTCRCAEGWKGWNCNIPICAQNCSHHGNCTGPNQCTCERGWSGDSCTIPLCAQECLNGGYCVAPDVCKCLQWPNVFRDGRLDGGRPLFQDINGNPLATGWTGFDCSVPICVQAPQFHVNVKSSSAVNYTFMGGHGGDSLLPCVDSSGNALPRCPEYDYLVTCNDGSSFQGGCGYDPLDTGCCLSFPDTVMKCYSCDSGLVRVDNHTFYCNGEMTTLTGYDSETDKFSAFLDSNGHYMMCGEYHSPRYHDYTVQPEDYGVAVYYTSPTDSLYSSYNYLSNMTSKRFLCDVDYWEQGDYVDDAGLGSATGVGSIFGLEKGRHIRINYAHIVKDSATATFKQGSKVYGEGVYACYYSGSCIAPDTCTCTDGYSGYDCSTPLCRHLQPSGKVTGCLNGGICVSKDKCNCVQTPSLNYQVHQKATKSLTGWTGSDCSIPICTQGFFDPFCTDLPQAPAGEGCYRCSNGGNCTAPDVCTCAPGWTGYDCRTPVCEVVADPLTRTQLGTVYEDKVISFESDPCSMVAIHGWHGWHGRKYTRGNCTQPNQCTCLCKIPYSVKACKKTGSLCNGPWQDPMANIRNLLMQRGVDYTFGTADCAYGYEGNVDSTDHFTTCHQVIFLPSMIQRNSITFIVVFSLFGFFGSIAYYYFNLQIRKKMLMAKIERRRSKRSSEESLLKADAGAFTGK